VPVPHLLLRELRGEVLEKLPPRLEIALHCNEHSRRNVLTAKKAEAVKLPKNKAIHNSASGRASRAKPALDKSLAIGVSNLRIFIRSVYSIATYSVPVVQRTERGFPKGKTAFLLEFADVISSEQMTAFKRLE